jgi:cellulose biosynthesis protein BcsQ
LRIFALYNIKGGVGKTAGAVNLSLLSAMDGNRTLLIDLDPQGSTSYYFRIRSSDKFRSKQLLKGRKVINKGIKGSDFENLDVLPSHISYRNLDLKLDNMSKSKVRLKTVLKPFKKDYDIIFIDCPPNITLVSENIFNAADYLLIPCIPTTLSMLTLKKLQRFISDNEIPRKKMLPFFSMAERRKKLHRDIIADPPVKKIKFFKNLIPYSSDIERMGLTRAPVIITNKKSAASKSYVKLWNEIKERIK